MKNSEKSRFFNLTGDISNTAFILPEDLNIFGTALVRYFIKIGTTLVRHLKRPGSPVLRSRTRHNKAVRQFCSKTCTAPWYGLTKFCKCGQRGDVH